MIKTNPKGVAAVVDVFCGIGGMTHGFVKEGFRVCAGIDIDPACKFSYEKNNGTKFIEADLRTMKPAAIAALFPKDSIRIAIGCAPCQPFSSYNRLDRRAGQDLLERFGTIVRELGPEIVSMENVPRIIGRPVFKAFLRTLKKSGYEISENQVDCADYGVPQTRRRLVILASTLGKISMIPPTHDEKHRRSVRDAIGHLPAIQAGTYWPKDRIHQCRALSELNLRRIRATPAGGGWQDWPDDLLLECHQTDEGSSFQRVYGRMIWGELAPTITTQCIGLGNGRFGHPKQHRAISLREAALLQTFPRNYKFVEPRAVINQRQVARHIGNAVPPRLGRAIARSIARHLEEVA